MTDNDLKKLKRVDLLELLIEQSKENERLQTELQKASEKLQSRKITLEKAGSIAEASLQLNGVFEAVEAAGAQYLENIELLKKEQLEISARLESESREKCRIMEIETQKKCNDMVTRAEQESKAYWNKVKKQLEEFYSNYVGLRELLSISVPKGFNDNSE